jgi:RimJ/RimL family protein N-acetyltransferase
MDAPALLLIDATYNMLEAAGEDEVRLAKLLHAAVAQDWAGFPESLPALLEARRRDPHSPWGTLFFLLEEPRTLIGMGGYKGEPDEQGVVEIGYAIAPAYQRRGFATRAARMLVQRAFADENVQAVEAQTLAHPNASTRVLEKVGLRRVGESSDPDLGPLWLFRIARDY